MERSRAFLRLTHVEQVILIEAAAALLVTWFGLRVFGFRRWSFVLRPMSNPLRSLDSKVSMLAAARTIAAMESAAVRNLFLQTNCLERSIVLRWLLSSRGISSELRIGAQKRSNKFEAHAWIECEGVVLNDIEDVHSHFVPFDAPLASAETTSN